MLDTVRLWTKDFAVPNREGWRRNWQEDVTTGEVMGETWSRILPSNSCLKVRANSGALFYDVHSLPGLVHGSSLHELHEDEQELALAAMRKELREGGVDYDEDALASWRLSRVDFCRNIKVDHHASEYIKLLELGDMPYMRPKHEHCQTALWFSGEAEFTCYDKVKAVMDKGQALAAEVDATTPRNVVRIEARYKNARAIDNRTGDKSTGEAGCRTFTDAWSSRLAKRLLLENFDKVANIKAENVPLISFDLARLQQLKAEHSRYFVTLWLFEAGMDAKLSEYGGDIDAITNMLSDVCSRTQLHDIKRQLKGRIACRQPERVRLLAELRDKLAS